MALRKVPLWRTQRPKKKITLPPMAAAFPLAMINAYLQRNGAEPLTETEYKSLNS